jgi:hypothetical protein
MAMKRLYVISFMFFALLLTMGHPASAKSTVKENPNKSTFEQLTKQEQNYILNEGGYTVDQVNDYPLSIMKDLITNKVQQISYNSAVVAFDENGKVQDGLVGPLGVISDSVMSLRTYANKVTNDKTGKQKLYMYGSWNWKNHPSVTLTDVFAVGWPSSEGVWIPITSSGAVDGYQAGYYDTVAGSRYLRTFKTSPDYTGANSGVGFEFDIRGGAATSDGYVGQYVYSNSLHNTFNIRSEYGHQTLSWSPGFSIYPAGVGISVTTGVDTKSILGLVSF